MTKQEEKTLKMNLLGGMDDYIRNVVGDETLWMDWISCGVPDEATEEDLEWIADTPGEFEDCCRLFGKLVFKDWKDNNNNN